MTHAIRPWALRTRLLVGMVLGMLVALSVTGMVLSRLFENELEQQIRTELARHLDRVTSQVSLSPDAPAEINSQALTDPRWAQPYSGLYWQLHANDGSAALRSRSMWDSALDVQPISDGTAAPVLAQVPGPQRQELMVLSRSLHLPEAPEKAWTLSVAVDHAELHSGARSFNTTLAIALGLLFLLMLALSGIQLAMGLAPLQALQLGLARLKQGDSAQLEGQYPAELQPLVDDLNHALKQQTDAALLAREQAGNLAHGVKTPLSVMQQMAQNHVGHPLAEAVKEQVGHAKRQIDWHLAKSRAAAAHHQVHEVTSAVPLIDSLVRAMRVVHQERNLQITWHAPATHIAFLGAATDFQEMLGNVLDNACQWASTNVSISLGQHAPKELILHVDDDGPGLTEAEMKSVIQRGARLDERQSGSGLGLAIAQDLALTYGGQLTLSQSPQGGLRATLGLPARWSE